MMTPLLALALLTAAPETPPETPPETAVHALVVAHNRSSDNTLAPLRYADDDGARWFELLGLGASKVRLLSVMDAETQARHPEAAKLAVAPTSSELERALQQTFADIEADRKAGRRTAFFFVYVGHGSVDEDGMGSMHLVDRTFSRADLFSKVIAPSPATVNHLVVDACHAYLMVAKRGGDDLEARIDQALAGFLAREDLDAYPNTGVLLSTSSSKEVHEWSRFQAGIFSHEVRSALAGAADMSGDGAVDYVEVQAFVAAANAKVENPSARLEVFARPPAIHLSEPLFNRSWAPEAPTLTVPSKLAGPWWLEDERGVRFADFHTAAGTSIQLTLVPRPVYFLRNPAAEEIELRSVKNATASAYERRGTPLTSRGSEAQALERGLFAVPFGRAWFEGYVASRMRPTAAPSSEAWLSTERPREGWGANKIAATGLFVGAVVAGVASATLMVESEDLAARYRGAVGTDDQLDALRGRAEDRALAGTLLGVAAGVLLGSGALTLSF